MAAGEVSGLLRGASLQEVERALTPPFVEEVDGQYGSVRRDYGLLEPFPTMPPDSTLTGLTPHIHRLSNNRRLARKTRRRWGLRLPPYLPWTEPRQRLASDHGVTDLECRATGVDLTYRLADTGVNLAVVGGDGERGPCPGKGDVGSVSP